MAAFNYIALDSHGREKKGVLEGDSARQIRQKLRDQGLAPLEVTLVAEKAKISKKLTPRGKRVSVTDLALLTRQMATLLEASLPLEEVIQVVAEQTDKTYVKSILMGVRARVLEGHTLASGLKDFPRAFPKIYRATVASGEQSGRLEKVLDRLADFTERQHHIRQKIRQAMIYPALMTVVSIFIVGFLLAYVVPRMIGIFQQTGQQLPIMTKVLIDISAAIKSYGIYGLIILVILAVAFRIALKRPNFRYAWHGFLLRMPFLGKSLKTINTARFARTFGILSASAVPVLEAMHVGADLVTLLPIRDALHNSIAEVREGSNINSALRKTGYFPAMSIHLIASGEVSGKLEAMLERAANNQDRDVEVLIENLLTLFEPVLILVMGGFVLFIVLAILLPIFQMNQFTGQ